MKLRWLWFCAGLLLFSSSCTAVKLEHCALPSYKNYHVDCFPMDGTGLTSAKIVLQSIEEKNELMFETLNYRIVLAENQALPGRAIVRLKRACGDLACLEPEEERESFLR